MRYRRKLIESRTAERNRLLKLLETANIKISSVVSNVFGASGMAMLKALLTGTSSPEQMAQLAQKRMRSKIPELEVALEGRLEEHHRFILGMQLSRLEQLDVHIDELDGRIDEKLKPYKQQQQRLAQIPGVDRVVSASILAEIGTDMTVFKSSAHLAAWAGVCPGNNESAGKRKQAGHRKGNRFLQTMLVEAAQSAAKKKGSYFKNKFHRLKARRGHKRAAMAIAHKILVTAYTLLATEVDYRDLGEAYLDAADQAAVTRTLVRRLEKLGYAVALERAVA